MNEPLPERSGVSSDGNLIVVYLNADLDPVDMEAEAKYARVFEIDGSSRMIEIQGLDKS
jgi:hypothetical protein